MMRKLLLFVVAQLMLLSASAQVARKLILPEPATTPNQAQQEQIARKYGMFIHFGINTFHNEEWTDGSKPASSYTPTTIDADQWIRSAKEAGMTYVILVTKHHEGFCLWDSPLTEYDVANSGNSTNVVEAVAKACKKYKVGKLFTHDGKRYYMPWESTVCISQRWFYHTDDKTYKSVEELEKLYRQCTKNDNILILNCPPNREGRLREADVALLKELRKQINL